MFTKTTITDITAEDFEIPDYTADLGELIESSADVYSQLPLNRETKKHWRNKVNELVDEYNERRGLRIYSHVK